MSTTQEKLRNYFRAGYAGIYLTSYEEARVEQELIQVAKGIGFRVYVWTFTQSLIGPIGLEDFPPRKFTGEDESNLDPFPLLAKLKPLAGRDAEAIIPERSIVLLKDFHLVLGQPDPIIIRLVKDCLASFRTTNRRLVVLGCHYKLVPELEHEFTVVNFELPTKEQLGEIAGSIAESAGITLNGNLEKIKEAAAGMTTIEAEDSFALAAVESGKTDISPSIVQREKSNVVRKQGILEIVDQNVTIEEIGGLEYLKGDLYEKRNLFTKEARDFGLPSPRGILVVGQPGTGKSLTATATKTIFNVPLVRLEAGRLFGGLVGQSEENWRTAFNMARAIAPVCFWLDEADGLVSGAKSSGQTDGGTTARVVKAMLQDMQFNSEGIFYVLTANDIDGFPDALVDRLDVWSVDLPNQVEREAIWTIHIGKLRGGQTVPRDPKSYDVHTLAKLTDGYSGRQIEQLWLKALTVGFNAGKREPSIEDVKTASTKFVPTSVTMQATIEARRKRLQGKAQPAGASSTTTESVKPTRQIV